MLRLAVSFAACGKCAEPWPPRKCDDIPAVDGRGWSRCVDPISDRERKESEALGTPSKGAVDAIA